MHLKKVTGLPPALWLEARLGRPFQEGSNGGLCVWLVMDVGFHMGVLEGW